MLRCRYQILLVCAIVLGVFYISISAEINSVDDQGMIDGLLNSEGTSVKSLFIPQSRDGGYYRPVIGLSYELDRIVSFADRSFMHLHNIILHLVNVLLVFWMSRLLVPLERRGTTLLPIAASLMFGLHPIVTESVNWISGRTDILSGIFVLLAAVFLLKYKLNRSRLPLLAAALVLCLGAMAKETALGFVFGAAFLLSARNPSYDGSWNQSIPLETNNSKGIIAFTFFAACGIVASMAFFNFWSVLVFGALYYIVLDYQLTKVMGVYRSARKYLRHFVMVALVTGGTIGFFVLMRKIVFVSNATRVSQTVKLIFQDPNYAFSVFFGAFGFYVKKFFLPYPQNFAIREIDPLYSLLGVALFFCCIYLLTQRTIPNALLFCGVFLLFPAFPIAFGTIAWTAYAERYIYISAAFWSVVCCYLVEGKLHRLQVPLRYQVAGVVLFLTCMGVLTLQRNIVWNTNLSLYADTVDKNPMFKAVRNEYMVALAKEKRFSEAIIQYQAASSVYTLEYHENLDLNMAKILSGQGKYDEALALYELCIKKGGGKSIPAHENTIEYLQKRIMKEQDQFIKRGLQGKLLKYNERLYDINQSPFTAYKTAQAALALKDKKKALHYFFAAKDGFEDKNPYKLFSEKLIAKLEQKN